MVLAGFRDATLSQLEAFQADATSLDQSSGMPPANLALAMSLLQSLSPQQKGSWLLQLAQALGNGTFDTTYDLLLADPAFRNFRDGIMYMLPVGEATPANAKLVIKAFARIVQVDPSQASPLAHSLFDWIRFIAIRAYLISIGVSPGTAEDIAVTIVRAWLYLRGTSIDNVGKYVAPLPSIGSPKLFFTDQSDILEKYIEGLYTKGKVIEAGRLFFGLYHLYKRMAEEPTSTWGVGWRWIDVGFWTIRVAANIFTNYPGVWISDIHKSIQGAIVPLVIGYVARLNDGTWRPVTAYINFNGCAGVGCDAVAKDILNWIGAAVDDLLKSPDLRIIGYHFFNARAGDLINIISETRRLYGNYNVAIIFTWWEGGQLKFTCIGLLCSQLSLASQQNQACLQAGLSLAECQAQFGTSPSNPSGPSTIGPAPPPDYPGYNYCIDFCII